MPLALSLLPELDGLDFLIEESMPWLIAWCLVLALIAAFAVVLLIIDSFMRRAPVEKMLRRRFG